MVPAADWFSCKADPCSEDSAGPGETEGPGEERRLLGGAALVPGGKGKGNH